MPSTQFDDRVAPTPRGIWYKSTASSPQSPATWLYSARPDQIRARPEQFTIYQPPATSL